MYTQHFKLTQDPFSIAPDPRFLFMSERHREALAHLLYGVSGQSGAGGGFVLLTGDIGAGKTTICRCFLAQIPANCHVAYLFNPKLTVGELLQSICEEFHVPLPPADPAGGSKPLIDALNTFLLQSHAAGQSCVLIIDEAQNLEPEVLEQLRLLTNLETAERKLLQIVLIGQPELRTLLAGPAMEQLAQRVVARFHLGALTPQETRAYVAHRLSVAGHGTESPFDARALARIHPLTAGVPRRINLLCGRALLGAWASGVSRVTRPMLEQAAAEVFDHSPKKSKAFLGLAPVKSALIAIFIIASAATLWAFWPHSPRPVAGLTAGVQATPAPATKPGSAPLAGAQPAAALAPPASATPSPQPASSARMANPGADSGSEQTLANLLPALASQPTAAWAALAQVWGLPQWPGLAQNPCTSVAQSGLACHQTNRLSVLQLRQLDRPGILTLRADTAHPLYAVLVGLDDHTATLQVGPKRQRVGWLALGQVWQGEFATFWRPPMGLEAALKNGGSGPAIDDLVARLGQLHGGPLPGVNMAQPVLDAALRQHIKAFQRANGMAPDGLPGPVTFMQLQHATGLRQPSLQATP
jgi:general secretion pathway protein A